MPPKLRAGKGAKASILTRFIKPKQHIPRNNQQHRSDVILQDTFDDEKGRPCYEFRFADNPNGPLLYGNIRYVKVFEEGDQEDYFEDLAECEGGKVKWQNSNARELLYQDILNGIIPLDARDEEGHETMTLQDIYATRIEYAAYDFDKFASRLDYLRTIIKKAESRAERDSEAFSRFVASQPVSHFSHKGYIQWQGSDAQALALVDIENEVHKHSGYKVMYLSRPEFCEQFPFRAFSEKIRQEIKTAKYMHTLRTKGKLHQSS